MKGLGKRFLTALVAVPILITLIVLKSWWFFGSVVFVGVGLAMWELYEMLIPNETKIMRGICVFFGLDLILALSLLWKTPQKLSGYAYPNGPGGIFAVTLLVALLFLFFLFVRGDQEQQKEAPRTVAAVTFGIFYLGLFGAHLTLLRQIHFGAGWILILFIATWLSDTGGYFFGKTIGGPKLYPSVSPNKTWAGLVGCFVGAAGSCIAIMYLKPTFPKLFPALLWQDVFVISLVVSVLGQLGDFFESLIKRANDVKDSGSLLPGHGGLLDRIDALIFAAPFVFYYATWIVLVR